MQTKPTTYRLPSVIAVVGLIALLVGFTLWLLVPGLQAAAWLILALGVLLLAVAFVLDFRRVRGALGSKRGRFGTGTTVMVSVFIGITLLITLISLATYHRFDLTGVSQFTLTSQTKEVLGQLETPVQVLFFYGVTGEIHGLLRNYAESLLDEYANYTDKLSVDFVDADEHPDWAAQYGVTQYSTTVFESEGHRRLVAPQEIAAEAEHAFTSAILEVSGIVQKKVYFLAGHGESSPTSTAAGGYNQAREGLRANLYRVARLDLLLTPDIPEDCAGLIIAGPAKALSSSEVAIIASYLENGGRVLILTNPASSPEIGQLLAPWGVKIEDGTVIDPTSYVSPNINSPMVPRTRNALGLSETYFPGATAIHPQEEVPENLQLVPLVWTSKDSWLEKDFDPRQEPEFDEGIDQEGSLALGVFIAMTLPAEGEELPVEEDTRIVVIGDSDFASNKHFYNVNNSDFFLTSVNMLTAGTEIISIDRKVLPFRRLVIGQEEENVIKYSSIILLPLLVLVVGGVIWWRRR